MNLFLEITQWPSELPATQDCGLLPAFGAQRNANCSPGLKTSCDFDTYPSRHTPTLPAFAYRPQVKNSRPRREQRIVCTPRQMLPIELIVGDPVTELGPPTTSLNSAVEIIEKGIDMILVNGSTAGLHRKTASVG